MKFGDDWRGVFIRGDNALNYWMTLIGVVRCAQAGEPIRTIQLSLLEDLANLLYSASQIQLPEAPEITKECQQMKPWEEAVASQQPHESSEVTPT